MKQFILRLSLVLIPFVLAMGGLLRVAYVSELDILKCDLICQTNIVAAVIGDSRVETYFDPKEIPWLRNFGLSATPFEITAHKARLIAELNPHIRLIVIDIWPQQFFSGIDRPYSTNSFAPYGIALIELMTHEDMPPFGDGIEVRVVEGVMLPGIRNLIKKITRKGECKGKITGGFLCHTKSIKEGYFNIACAHKIQSWPPKIPIELPPTPTGREIVLEHLLHDLTQKDINIVLTTTPMLWYEPRYTVEAKEYFERRMREISSKYNVPWYNWINEYQSNTNYWADVNHLNYIGARVFSRDVRGTLERHLTIPTNRRFRQRGCP